MHIIDEMTKRRNSRSLRSDAAIAIAEGLGWHSRLAARQITRHLDVGLATSGLSSAQFDLMCLIAAAPDDTLGGLADRASLNQSTMSRNVDVLVKEGWVEVATVVEDRRRRAVWLTEAGSIRLQEALPLWRTAHRALAVKLGPERARPFSDATEVLRSTATQP
jgi:DNA-binding MarR family transcriptional regulator